MMVTEVMEDAVQRIRDVLSSPKGVTVFPRGDAPLAERGSLLFVATGALSIMRDKPTFVGVCVGAGSGRYRIDGVSEPAALEPVMEAAGRRLAARSILLSLGVSKPATPGAALQEAAQRWERMAPAIEREGGAGVIRWRKALDGQLSRPAESVAGWLKRVGGAVTVPGRAGRSGVISGPILLANSEGVLQRQGRAVVLHAPQAVAGATPGQWAEVRYLRGEVAGVRMGPVLSGVVAPAGFER